ncbi:MAG: benzoate transporter [Micromonosporaceae bacterium]|nr:benzoate transporter [Micromonosporaceae bacterium]
MTASRQVRWLGVALGASVLLVAGCTSRNTPEETFRDPALASGEFTLVSFDSCDEAERQLRAAATAYVGPWGFGTAGMEMWEGDAAAAGQDGRAVPGQAPAAPGLAEEAAPAPVPGADPDHSTTNVHESGVDEPDLVKTDGRRIVTVSQGVLRVVDAQRKVETGRLDVRPQRQDPDLAGRWQPADLLLHGDRALVLFAEGWRGGEPVPDLPSRAGVAIDPVRLAPVTGPRLVLVDLTGSPTVLSEYTVDGGLVDARATGGTVRVVVRSAPRLSLPEPRGTAGEAAQLAANREAIQSAPLADWLPRFEVTTAGQTDTGQVDCTAMSRPESYSGTSMLTVLTFDLAAPALGDGAPVSVVADGDTVYSNGTSLYVASDQRWRAMPMPGAELDGPEAPQEPDDRTEIYRFDTSDPGPPRFAASGSVPGAVVNQYAMSEWEGHLRVATTTESRADGADSSESAVYVLAERDGELVETGSVGGLGKTERIYSVRFTGPVGYVVTFRETDPLYTLDLRDPAAPAVLGELKITGYSAYLHPLGDGRLVGVGQEADAQGREQGTQVSLFDVTDLSDPTRLGSHHVESGSSEAELDPHAFLWWPEQRLLVVPLLTLSAERELPYAGALVLRVEEEGFTALDVVTHPAPAGGEYSTEIRRSLVVGDTLWTISDLGLQANALSTLEETGWVPF